MRIPTIPGKKRIRRLMLWFHLAVSGVVIVLSWMLFICPAITICRLAGDSQLNRTGESRLVPGWFEAAAGRYVSWADGYIETNFARSIYHDDIPATEWPIFGSVFVLVTADDLQSQGKIDATQGIVREAVEKAAQIVASPVTATWVKTKWGSGYLERENVFYRMLLVLGLSSYQRITGNTQYHALMAGQRTSLAAELAEAKLHLRDDYPNECYPADMLWAVAAIRRADALDDGPQGTVPFSPARKSGPSPRHDALAQGLSWSLGEVALLFSMTRPTLAARTVPFTGHVPAVVWIMFAVYLGVGLFSIWFEIRSIRRRIRPFWPPKFAPALLSGRPDVIKSPFEAPAPRGVAQSG
jgi:hypothetical protein